MAKTKKEKKEKKAGKRMKKKELVKALLDFFHVKQDEVTNKKFAIWKYVQLVIYMVI